MVILTEVQVILVWIQKVLFFVESSWVFVVFSQVNLGMKQKFFLVLRQVLLLRKLDHYLLNV